MDRIIQGVTTLTCTLHDSPTIACDNQLAVIQALHQSIQRGAKLKLSAENNQHVTTPLTTRTRKRSIMRPIRRPNKDQPQDLRLPVITKVTINQE